MKHEEEEQQQQRWKTAQRLGLGQGFASVPRGAGPGPGPGLGPGLGSEQGLASEPELSSVATQISGLKDGSAPGLGPQSGGLTESDSGMGQVPVGLVDGLEGSEEEWLRTLQAYLTFPGGDNNGLEPTTIEESDMINTSGSIPVSIPDNRDIVMKGMNNDNDNNNNDNDTVTTSDSDPWQPLGKFVGASGLRQAPEQELGTGTTQGPGLDQAPVPEGLPGLSVDELERLRTMERLLTLIGDPLGGQGLGTGLGLETGTGQGLGTGPEEGQEDDVAVATTDVITTATPPDITTTSWLPKVPGF